MKQVNLCLEKQTSRYRYLEQFSNVLIIIYFSDANHSSEEGKFSTLFDLLNFNLYC